MKWGQIYFRKSDSNETDFDAIPSDSCDLGVDFIFAAYGMAGKARQCTFAAQPFRHLHFKRKCAIIKH